MERNIITCGLVIALLVVFSATGAAQVSQSCLNELGPCLNYLNGTRDPPDICCDPLKEIIKTDSECLCSLMSNQGAFQAQLLGINVTEAQELPGRCGQRVNPLACLSGGKHGTSIFEKSISYLHGRCSNLVCTNLYWFPGSPPSSGNSNRDSSSGVSIRCSSWIEVMVLTALSMVVCVLW